MQGDTIFGIVLYGTNATMVFSKVMVRVAYASKTKDIAVRCSKYGLKLLTTAEDDGLHYTVCLK